MAKHIKYQGICCVCNTKVYFNEETGSPLKQDFKYDNHFRPVRKSLSMNDIAADEDQVKLEINETQDDVHLHRRPTRAPHDLPKTKILSMAEAGYHCQGGTPDLRPIRKSRSMDDIAAPGEDPVISEHKETRDDIHLQRRPTRAAHYLPKTKFVSMAEAVYHYLRDTPGRFHMWGSQKFRTQAATRPTGLTVPHSPRLRCKERTRHRYFMSQKEKEQMEFEEIKKFKIKANPIPQSVKGVIHLPVVSRKPVTVPEPFKLSEIHKKSTSSPGKVQKFKARPAPKHILKKSQIPVKCPVQVTKPVSPKIDYKRVNSADHLMHETAGCSKNNEDKPQRRGLVKPQPFSFEKRDEELKKRREEWIKQQIQEERKQASQFRAQPVPVFKRHMKSTLKGSNSTTTENKKNS